MSFVRKNKTPYQLQYFIQDAPIKTAEIFKDLGVVSDNKLTFRFRPQIEEIVRKSNTICAIGYRLTEEVLRELQQTSNE